MNDIAKQELTAKGDPIDKGRADILVRLYERQMAHYEHTQGIEWKVSFGVWALLATGIGVATGRRLDLPSWMGVVPIVVAAAHVGWLSLAHRSEAFDKKLWMHYRKDLDALLGTDPPKPGVKIKRWIWWGKEVHADWIPRMAWLLVESTITTVLAVVLAALLAGSVRRCHHPSGATFDFSRVAGPSDVASRLTPSARSASLTIA